MLTSAALAEWLDDEARQARGLGGSRRFEAEAVAASPLAAFGHALDRVDGCAPPARAMLDVLAALHDLLAETAWVGDLVAAAARAAREDPFFEPPFATLGPGLQQGLVLVDHPLALVSLAVIPAAEAARRAGGGSRSIGFPGLASLARVLAGGGTEIALWETDEPGADFTSATAAPCRRAGRRLLADGDLLAIDGRTQTFAVERFAGDLVLLRGEVRAGAAPLAREYDPETLELIAVSTTDEAASRIGLLLSLVRASGRTEAAPVFARIAAQAPFFLRWCAMRELLALDPVAGLPVLHAMARDDPHPEVRAAAGETERTLTRRYPLLFPADRAAA